MAGRLPFSFLPCQLLSVCKARTSSSRCAPAASPLSLCTTRCRAERCSLSHPASERHRPRRQFVSQKEPARSWPNATRSTMTPSCNCSSVQHHQSITYWSATTVWRLSRPSCDTANPCRLSPTGRSTTARAWPPVPESLVVPAAFYLGHACTHHALCMCRLAPVCTLSCIPAPPRTLTHDAAHSFPPLQSISMASYILSSHH
jgi:hypothetical protein